MGVDRCLWECMGVYGSLDKYEYEGAYEYYASSRMSVGVYGCIKQSIVTSSWGQQARIGSETVDLTFALRLGSPLPRLLY